MRVAEIMKVRVATIEMDDALETVRELFSQAPFHHLLVVDETGQLVGILSDKDLFKALYGDRKYGWVIDQANVHLNDWANFTKSSAES